MFSMYQPPLRCPSSAALMAIAAAFSVAASVTAQAPVETPSPPSGAQPPVPIQAGAHAHPPYPQDADGAPATVMLLMTVDAAGAVTDAIVEGVDREGAEAEPFARQAQVFAHDLRFLPASVKGRSAAARVRYQMKFMPPGHRHAASKAGSTGAVKADLGRSSAPAVPDGQHGKVKHTHTHAHAGDRPKGAGRDPASLGATARIGRRVSAASTLTLPGKRLRRLPYRSAGDLLQAVPGAFVVQHAGGGKAQQYFLRGFDADHGSDIAFSVDGIPINGVSHGHGQGYTDLHWVIPELVADIQVRKGPYAAKDGDFATAGAIDYRLVDRLPASVAQLTYGSFDTRRGVVAVNPDLGIAKPIIAAEYYRTDGPFELDENVRRLNLFSRGTFDLGGAATATFTGFAHQSRWRASGQIPQREVKAGRLDRFGFVDSNEGGSTRRVGVVGHLRSGSVGDAREDPIASQVTVDLWLTRSQFDLYSNFTFFSADPTSGDMIHQQDDRITYGFRGRYDLEQRWGDFRFDTGLGVQLRADEIDNSLARAPARETAATTLDAQIQQQNMAAFASQSAGYRDDVMLTAGLRGDLFSFDLASADGDMARELRTGPAEGAQVSPKLGLRVSPLSVPSWLEGFANFGFGFHSNDARSVRARTGSKAPLAQAVGYELGLRSSPLRQLHVALVGFGVELESELVWVGDDGTTEASGQTRRLGVEGRVRAEPWRWLVVELQSSLSRARFVDAPAGASQVPLAPRFVLSGSLEVAPPGTGFWGRLGLLHVGDRPATEDGFLTAEGMTRVDLSAGYLSKHFGVDLRIGNLLGSEYRAAQFATVSRLAGETAADCDGATRAVVEGGGFVGCEDVNFTPGPPFEVLVTGTARY